MIVEIRGGAGGEESALFAAVLFRMYTMYAEHKGFQVEVLNKNETELGGFKEISFLINGEYADHGVSSEEINPENVYCMKAEAWAA